MGTVVIIIPAYEPDNRLIKLLTDLHKNTIFPIVIVNDGSESKYDIYFNSAENIYDATVLKHSVNQGKGQALKTAFEYCLKKYPDLQGCITVDSDGQHSADSIKDIKENADIYRDSLILGVRDFNGSEVPDKSKFGNKLTKKIFMMLYKTDISDTQTGLRYIPKFFMKELLIVKGNRFEFETKMLIEAVKSNINIREIGIETIYDSKDDHQTHFRPIVDSIRIYSLFLGQFCRYTLSSLSSCIIDLVIFNLMCVLLRRVLGLYIYISVATVCARIISSIYNYLVNFKYVFRSDKAYISTAIRYFILVGIQMSLSAGLTSLVVDISGVSTELLVKIPVDTLLFFISYYIQKKFIY